MYYIILGRKLTKTKIDFITPRVGVFIYINH